MPGCIVNPNYVHTITLYNRLKAIDSPDKKERWKKTIIKNCFYKAEIVETQSGTQVTKSNTYTVRIPDTPEYRPYAEWKEDGNGFTVSEDDIVVYGSCTDEVTGENGNTAAQMLLRHKPNAFKIKAFSDNTTHCMGKHYRIGG